MNIAKAFERLAPVLSVLPASIDSGNSSGATISSRRRPRLSASQRSFLKLQGRYMGTMRALSRIDQAKVKAVRKRSGIQAAISRAQRLAAK